MYCKKCGKLISPPGNFCSYCGEKTSSTYRSDYFVPLSRGKNADMALIALILSIASLLLLFKSGWAFPLAGAAIAFGAMGLKSERRSMSIAAMIIGAVSMTLLVFIGFYAVLFAIAFFLSAAGFVF